MHNFISAYLRTIRPSLGGLWRHPCFVKLWAGQTVSGFGSQVTILALPLLAALSLGASPGQMGLLTAASTAPNLLIGLLVGVWVDRVRRRPLMIAADVARAALLLTIPTVWALDLLRIELLYAVAFLAGAWDVVFGVAYVSLLPSLVGRERLVEANGKLEASRSLAQVGGPALGGALVSLLTTPVAIFLDARSYLVSAAFLVRVRVAESVALDGPESRRVLREIREGLRAVFAHPLLRPLVLCSTTINLFGYVFLSVYVLYLTNDLGLGPGAVGVVFALGGVGALLGALLADPLSRRLGAGPAMVSSMVLTGLAGMAISLAVLFPAIALPMVLFAEFAQWLFLVIYRVGEVSTRQRVTPDRLRGRVSATVRSMVAGAIPLGALLGGVLGEVIGVPPTLVVGMIGMLAASFWLVLSPVRRIRQLPAATEASYA